MPLFFLIDIFNFSNDGHPFFFFLVNVAFSAFVVASFQLCFAWENLLINLLLFFHRQNKKNCEPRWKEWKRLNFEFPKKVEFKNWCWKFWHSLDNFCFICCDSKTWWNLMNIFKRWQNERGKRWPLGLKILEGSYQNSLLFFKIKNHFLIEKNIKKISYQLQLSVIMFSNT